MNPEIVANVVHVFKTVEITDQVFLDKGLVVVVLVAGILVFKDCKAAEVV